MGMIGSGKPKLLTYEPFYRAILGMAVGYWATGCGMGFAYWMQASAIVLHSI